MTHEEAKEILNGMYGDWRTDEEREALEVAIMALNRDAINMGETVTSGYIEPVGEDNNVPTIATTVEYPDSDVISREAALDAIDNIDKTACMNEYHAIVKAIDDLPSVQPVGTIPLSVIEDIKAEIRKMPNRNPSYTHTCDVVDREDVLDIIDEYISGKDAE